MFKVPEQARITKAKDERLVTDATYGNNGAFIVGLRTGVKAFVIASDGEGWEHVSVHVTEKIKGRPFRYRCATWDEMCGIKDLFWDPEDMVLQYHPPRSQYVNMHPFTLHLWRPIGVAIPSPPTILIGFGSKLQTEIT